MDRGSLQIAHEDTQQDQRAFPLRGPVLRGSPARAQLDEVVERVAETDDAVLVWGECGVGKGAVAHRLHELSRRRDRPFVKVNCAARPPEQLEIELFGHDQLGKIEAAHTGTMYLREVGELPPSLQDRLLQVLEAGYVAPAAGRRRAPVDVRVISATSKPLAAAESVHPDLYYRLNVFAIRVPTLRECVGEIPGLVLDLVERYSVHYGRPRREISAETLRRFTEHSWPGNVRELENLVKRIVLVGDEEWVCAQLTDPSEPPVTASLPVIAPDSFWSYLAAEVVSGRPAPSLKDVGRQAARTAERALLRAVLDRVRWNRRLASRHLKISYKALLQKIQSFGLH